MSRFARDIDVLHRRRWPGRPISLASRSWLLVSSPGLRLMLIHRIDHWIYSRRARFWQVMKLALALPKWATQVNAKSEIPNDREIGGGVCFSDQGHIIFGARKAGSGMVVGPRVTVGMSPADAGRPEIGRNVWIGPDCIVYGAIRIGDGATLLPGTVLSKSIPAGVVMQGNPARLLMRDFDNTELRENPALDVMQLLKTRRGA